MVSRNLTELPSFSSIVNFIHSYSIIISDIRCIYSVWKTNNTVIRNWHDLVFYWCQDLSNCEMMIFFNYALFWFKISAVMLKEILMGQNIQKISSHCTWSTKRGAWKLCEEFYQHVIFARGFIHYFPHFRWKYLASNYLLPNQPPVRDTNQQLMKQE